MIDNDVISWDNNNMMMDKKVTVLVKNRHRICSAHFRQAKVDKYVGSIVPLYKWQIGQPLMNLTTGNSFFPVRTISIEDILSIDDVKPEFAIRASQSKVHHIEGSSGTIYAVTEENGSFSCTCVGFGFRHNCKHVKEARNVH